MNSTAVRLLADQLFQDVNADGTDPSTAVTAVLRSADGELDPARCARLVVSGPEQATAAVERALSRIDPTVSSVDRTVAARRVVELASAAPGLLTGGQVVGLLMATAGVEQVFAYAGTSELPLCDAVDELPGITLMNGRGDKESAFMAAGASLLRPGLGAAILHGARGLTNAAGALADARRCEAGTVFVVGLPSTGSMRFLPPHGEDGLIDAMGHFARWSWEAPAVPVEEQARRTAAVTYVRKFAEAVDRAARQPWGPVLYGVPQDVSEKPWIPIAALTEGTAAEAPATVPLDEAAVPLIAASSRPVILIDDYALRIPGIREALDSFSRRIGAAVLQLRYRRGLMMFERLQPPEVRNYVGWLNPFSPAQRAMLDECDLFITVEDRNIYQRVAGDLPPCRKLAINTDPAKVHKNEYLGSGDVLLEGDAATVLTALSEALGPDPDAGETWFAAEEVRKGSDLNAEMPSDLVFEGRTRVADAVAGLVSGWSRPVLIDDSSMFGGLLVEHYDKLPLGLRVFGGHGGFVGGGLAYAIGLAIAEPEAQVICTLGDQAFTNSHQALVAAVQQRANLVILVCNNGRAVSLNKQAVASYGEAPRHYLDNVDEFRYCDVAQAIGVAAERVSVPVGAAADVVAGAAAELSGALARAGAVDGPALVELVLPADPEAWKGIWVASGFEQNAPVHAS